MWYVCHYKFSHAAEQWETCTRHSSGSRVCVCTSQRQLWISDVWWSSTCRSMGSAIARQRMHDWHPTPCMLHVRWYIRMYSPRSHTRLACCALLSSVVSRPQDDVTFNRQRSGHRQCRRRSGRTNGRRTNNSKHPDLCRQHILIGPRPRSHSTPADPTLSHRRILLCISYVCGGVFDALISQCMLLIYACSDVYVWVCVSMFVSVALFYDTRWTYNLYPFIYLFLCAITYDWLREWLWKKWRLWLCIINVILSSSSASSSSNRSNWFYEET